MDNFLSSLSAENIEGRHFSFTRNSFPLALCHSVPFRNNGLICADELEIVLCSTVVRILFTLSWPVMWISYHLPFKFKCPIVFKSFSRKTIRPVFWSLNNTFFFFFLSMEIRRNLCRVTVGGSVFGSHLSMPVLRPGSFLSQATERMLQDLLLTELFSRVVNSGSFHCGLFSVS